MSAEAARSVMDHARVEVVEGEGGMQKIKAALRSVAASGDDPMKPAGKAVMMIDVIIVSGESMAPLDAVTDKNATMAVNSTLGNRSPLKESP